MSYSEKLKDPKWQRKRLEILQRDNFTCRDCYDDTKTLHVHHLHYENGKEPWDYPDEWLLTLCADCHDDVSENRKKIEEALIKNFRLKVTNTFNMRCVSEVFEKHKDLHGLMYLIWEMLDYQDDVDEMLREFWHKRKTEFYLSKSEPMNDRRCNRCGEYTIYNYKNVLYLCNLCGGEEFV